ncbi:hypothetical protein ACTG16_23295 [Aeromonas sp. 23P]|uniref:hypothetical protein n=1 Tax=Aeromonas sp. 23P TaxID=3452716 RepID=UPI003F78E2C1
MSNTIILVAEWQKGAPPSSADVYKFDSLPELIKHRKKWPETMGSLYDYALVNEVPVNGVFKKIATAKHFKQFKRVVA